MKNLGKLKEKIEKILAELENPRIEAELIKVNQVRFYFRVWAYRLVDGDIKRELRLGESIRGTCVFKGIGYKEFSCPNSLTMNQTKEMILEIYRAYLKGYRVRGEERQY